MAGRLECFFSLYLIVTIMAFPTEEKVAVAQDSSFAKNHGVLSPSIHQMDFIGNFTFKNMQNTLNKMNVAATEEYQNLMRHGKEKPNDQKENSDGNKKKRSLDDNYRKLNLHHHYRVHHKKKGHKYKLHKHKIRNKIYYGRYKTNATDLSRFKLRHGGHIKYGKYTEDSLDSLLEEEPFESSDIKLEKDGFGYRSSFRKHFPTTKIDADQQSFRNKLHELRWLELQRQKQQEGLWFETNDIGENWMGGRPKPTSATLWKKKEAVSKEEQQKLLTSNSWTDGKNDWPRFFYHRVTLSPLPQSGSRLLKHQRSAYVAVSLISQNTTNSKGSALQRTKS